MKKILLCGYIVMLLIMFGGWTWEAHAAGSIIGTTTEQVVADGYTFAGCINDGSCTLDDFIKIALNVSKWILGITGSLTLLMFIYGGVMFLISSGSSEKVTQAKQIIIGAVIGLIIVFAAYTIIRFTFKAMGLDWKGTSKYEDITPTPPNP